jgi:metal-sulfur cluster biosynthetic enzyme
MVTEEQVLTAMHECYDPEVPLNIVDMGLVYGVHITPAAPADGSPADVVIDLTMTSPGCPSHSYITEDVKHKVAVVPGVRSVTVNLVWTPPWSPERLTPAARQKLGIE